MVKIAGRVEKRGKNSWRLEVSLGYDENGKQIRKRKTVQAKGITEARILLAKFRTEIESGEYIEPTKMKFEDLVKEWQSKYADHKLSPKTIETYNFILNAHILPKFKNKSMDSFLPIHITDYLLSLKKNRLDGKEGGLSSATIQKHYNLLSNIFSFAKRNYIIKNNPVENAEKPIVKYKKSDVYTTDEVLDLLYMLNKEPLHQRLMIELAIDTGMRRGEIMGLQWEDIDFNKNKIRVQHSLSYTKRNGYQLKETKTENIRTVIASKYLINELKTYYQIKRKERLQAAELWQGGKYFFVFSNWDGKPYHPDTPSTWWNRFLKRKGFKKITFHDLRHTAATLLINEGLHAKLILITAIKLTQLCHLFDPPRT